MAAYDRHNPGDIKVATVAFTAGAAGIQTDAAQAITGFNAADMPVGSIILAVIKATDQAGLSMSPGGLVTTAGSAPAKFVNPTAGSITPTAGDNYTVVWIPNFG